MLTPEERYHRDPLFRSLVDVITHYIASCTFTPTELREAVILAAIRYERVATRPVVYHEGNVLTHPDGWSDLKR